MEYQASSVALSQKLSNGHSIYDGVFSSPASKFKVSAFSSRVEDYTEIFGGSGASRGSSIPVLEVPELHERKASVDVRSSKLDYSNVFSGFGDSDFGVPYEELFAEPKKRGTSRTPAERRAPSEETNPSSCEGNGVLSHEASYPSFDGAKKFNMSYHKSNHRSKSFTGGTMLRAVPAYTCLVDEVTPVRVTEADKPVSNKENGACTDNSLGERIMDGNHSMKATRDHLAGDASKQTSGGGAKVQNNYDQERSGSNDEVFNACEIGEGRTRPSNRPPISSLVSEDKVKFEKPMASTFGISKSDYFEGSDTVHSPPYFDEEVDTNSIAAASAAALTKAIQEAQARIKMAKNLKERNKAGLQNHVKLRFNNDTKLEVRKGDKFVDKASIPKERKTQELHEEVAVPVHVSTGPEQLTAAFEDVDKISGAKEAGEETQEKESKLSQSGQRQEEADVSEATEQFYEFDDAAEPDVSEAAEQFYEFADTGEPDLSEAVEQFYEFSDSSETQAMTLEHEEANTAIKVMQFVDKDEQEKKKTTMEAFETPQLGGESSQAAEEEENREVEKIFDADGGQSKYEEHCTEFATTQKAFDQEENEKIQEAAIDHEELGKLKASHVMEEYKEKPGELEKQKGDNKRLETQELQDTRHVKRKLMAQEQVEFEKIGKEACKQEEHEREQRDVHGEEDTERSFNKDSGQEIIKETPNDFKDEEDFENERKSEGNEKVQDTRENEKILEGAPCQKKEDLKNQDCKFETIKILCEQGESEDLNKKEGPISHVEYDREVEVTPKVPAHENDGGRIEVTETLIELKENGSQSELVEEDNGVVEKEIHETEGLAPGVKLPEILKQMEDATEIHSSDRNGISAKRNDMGFGENQDYHFAREPEIVLNLGKHVEESGDLDKDMMEAEVSANHEKNKINSKSSHRKRWSDIIDVSETLIKLKENGNLSESVEEENAVEEKEICETDGLALGVKLAEILKEMEDSIETPPSDENDININRNAMNFWQKQNDQLAGEPVVLYNLEEHVEESEEINKDMMEAEVAVNQEESKNNSRSSQRKRWFGDGKNTEVAQLSHMFRRKGGNVLLDHEMQASLRTKENKEKHEKLGTNQRLEENEENQQATLTKESETIDTSLKEVEQEKSENCQTTFTAEESETEHSSQKDVREGKNENQVTLTTQESENNCTSQKEVERERKENQQETLTAEECETSDCLQKEVEIEKEHQIQKANAKGRERERVKERKAVERVIREARERAFAEARERAAETRQRVMAEAQEKLGKTSGQANDISLAEKASKEAKLKAERAAVERATVEARERALEKALSGKAAYEAGKQTKRSLSEKFSGASRDDGLKPGVSPFDPESKGSFPSSTSRNPNSSNHSDPYSAERSGGTNGESAQRSKARLERNQRTAERAAKALAEKNMRDLLVQKEQAERNRLAEALDADVKRWSSGKERNLRALLSTLQYILGPDSGWQPIPLTDVVTAVAVKKAYRKAALFVHPDKLQQRGASIQQKYTCEKVFDLLKEAWNRFNVEER
ncbi:unnamed protein product [Prunus armeniaca]|uniref:J domain-containing protein n=1 Tax=Prunus armeniaca TaxID=36596 RepID=A0A6J5W9M3_PRUAR|nr:unnamed protein product [Prunus armeniaca]